MMNDFDYIKDQLDNSGVNAPDHMDESYVLDRLSHTQPKLVTLKRNKRIGWITGIAAALVVAVATSTAVGVYLHNARIAVPSVTKKTGLIHFTNYDQIKTALHEINERNGYDLLANAESDEDYGITAGSDAMKSSGSASGSSSSGSASGSGSSSNGSSYAYAGEGGGSSENITLDGAYSGDDSASHSDTYKQVEAVDEADIIKTDGRYIYAVEHKYEDSGQTDGVAVFTAVPGTEKSIVTIVPGDPKTATADEEEPDQADKDSSQVWSYHSHTRCINDIFLKDNRLVILYSDMLYYELASDFSYHSESLTRAYVYDVTDPVHYTLLDTFTQSGDYTSSRMIGDTLYLITADPGAEDIPVCGHGSTPDQLPADCVYSVSKPSVNTFLIVSAYDTLNRDAVSDSKAILGAAEDVYCNEENLYITATDWHYYYGLYEVDYAADGDSAVSNDTVAAAEEQAAEFEPTKTSIYKVSLTDGLSFTGYAKVEGYIDSQYSLDEYQGNLRVAATTENKNYEQTNNLYVLDENMKLIGSVTGFADDEHIEAVRFVGDTAYVITYRTTDPLFVIDLSDPTAPAILGEVKISGFSTMLVPLDGNMILGLGINTDDYATYDDIEVQDGFKLALFDVSDPTHPQVLDSRSYVHCYSDVMYTPKALVYNADRNDFVIPLNYALWDYDEDSDTYTEEQYGGMLNFAVRGGKLVETDRYRSVHNYVERCVYVGDTVYMTHSNSIGKLFLESVSYR